MINTQPYHDKLDKLQDELFKKIESVVVLEMWMDLQVCDDGYYIKKGLPLPKPFLRLFYFYVTD